MQTLKRYPSSYLFLAREANSDHNELIEECIDLNSVENMLVSGEYLCAYHFARDIKKMLSNAFLLHSREPEIFSEIFEFSKHFELVFKGCKDLLFSEGIVQDLNRKVEKLSQNIKDMQSKIPQVKNPKDKKMTTIEKKQLCQSLKKLEPKYLNGVLKIVKGCMDIQGDELEFDVEKLPQKVCRELERYIKQCLQIKPQRKKSAAEYVKTEAISENQIKSEAEPHSESSESSSSSSESEDEMPGAPMYSEIWERDIQDFTNATSIIDFD